MRRVPEAAHRAERLYQDLRRPLPADGAGVRLERRPPAPRLAAGHARVRGPRDVGRVVVRKDADRIPAG